MSDQQPPGAGPDEPTESRPQLPPPYHPPAGPPEWPPLSDQGPPTAAQPPVTPPLGYADPQYGVPLGSPATPPTHGAPGGQGAPGARSSRAGLVVGLVVVAALLAAGVIGVLLATRSAPELTLDITTCEIAADGALSATGTVDGPDDAGVTISVDFVDSSTGDTVDRGETSVELGGDGSWEVTGTAGDEVLGVRCDVTADD